MGRTVGRMGRMGRHSAGKARGIRMKMRIRIRIRKTRDPEQPRVQDRDTARATMRTYGKRWEKIRKQLIRNA